MGQSVFVKKIVFYGSAYLRTPIFLEKYGPAYLASLIFLKKYGAAYLATSIFLEKYSSQSGAAVNSSTRGSATPVRSKSCFSLGENRGRRGEITFSWRNIDIHIPRARFPREMQRRGFPQTGSAVRGGPLASIRLKFPTS